VLSSSTPIRAASRRGGCKRLSQGARLYSTSAYGGIIAFNRKLDADAANAVAGIFTEVIIAPDATDEAIAIIGKRKNLRLLLAGGLPIRVLQA
jgi:AICAR transformylase/IMP cyclohydrolase PurH